MLKRFSMSRGLFNMGGAGGIRTHDGCSRSSAGLQCQQPSTTRITAPMDTRDGKHLTYGGERLQWWSVKTYSFGSRPRERPAAAIGGPLNFSAPPYLIVAVAVRLAVFSSCLPICSITTLISSG